MEPSLSGHIILAAIEKAALIPPFADSRMPRFVVSPGLQLADDNHAALGAEAVVAGGAEDPQSHWLNAFDAVRRETERRAALLSAEDQVVQSMPDASPTKWHR